MKYTYSFIWHRVALLLLFVQVMAFSVKSNSLNCYKYIGADPIARIPFQFENNQIIVTVFINQKDRPVRLLFDTGADGIALNRPVAEALSLRVTRQQHTSFVGGNRKIEISGENQIQLEEFSFKGQNIAIFDQVSTQVDGILGVTLAYQYIVSVNFDTRVIELYAFDTWTPSHDAIELPMDISSGIPTVPIQLQIGKKEANGSFVFDTGAQYYVIAFSPFVQAHQLIEIGFIPYFPSSTSSMGHTSNALCGDFKKISLGKLSWEHVIGALQIPDATTKNWVNSEKGSVGIRLIQEFNFVLDRKKSLLYLKPNQFNQQPKDLYLNGYYLRFAQKEDLRVEKIIEGNDVLPLAVGDPVLSINGKKMSHYYQHPLDWQKLQENTIPVTIEYLHEGKKHNHIFR